MLFYSFYFLQSQELILIQKILEVEMKLFYMRKPTTQQIDNYSIATSSQTRSINLKQSGRSSVKDIEQQSKNKIFFQKLMKKNVVEESEEYEKSYTSIPKNIKISNFNSNIVQNEIGFKKFLDFQNCDFDLRLAYRASQQNFDTSKFHKFCKNLNHTIILAEIKDGNIVGGYSPLSWQDNYQEAKTYFKTDKTQKTFIFNYTSKQIYNLVKISNNKAIVASQYLGPTFGGGYDISIGNFANIKYSSSCNFPTSYSKLNDQFRILKLNRKSLIGIKQHEQSFLIKQWEVFEVLFYSNNEKQDRGLQCNQYQQQKKEDKKKQTEKKYWSKVRSVFFK